MVGPQDQVIIVNYEEPPGGRMEGVKPRLIYSLAERTNLLVYYSQSHQFYFFLLNLVLIIFCRLPLPPERRRQRLGKQMTRSSWTWRTWLGFFFIAHQYKNMSSCWSNELMLLGS